MTADLLVIGGGPAGLATAIAAAQTGLRVEVAEPLPGAIDKCCGEGLLPPALTALARLGIAPDEVAASGLPFAGIEFLFRDGRARARFGSPAYGVRRTALHDLLRGRARTVGVRTVAASAKLTGDGRVRLSSGEERRPGWVVGADGAQSSVRAAAGLERGRVISRRFALRAHFRLGPGRVVPEFVEVHWARRAQAYVTPVGPGQVGVAIVASAKLAGIEAALALFPSLQPLLAGAAACSAPRGAVTLHRNLREVQNGRAALVGDASGSVDAITGDGLSLGLGHALALGAALGAGDLAAYTRAHRALMRVPRVMSRALLLMGAHPALTAASVGLLGGVPGLFTGLLRVHVALPEPAGREAPIPA